MSLDSLTVGVAQLSTPPDHEPSGSRELDASRERVPISFLHAWRRRRANTNVFRSLTLYDAHGAAVLFGPLSINIDGPQLPSGAGDLEGAAAATRVLIEQIGTAGVDEDDLRVFFSGRRGFNVEVAPQALGLSCSPDPGNVRRHCDAAAGLIAGTRPTHNGRGSAAKAVADRGTAVEHVVSRAGDLRRAFVRLSDSRNAWLEPDGTERALLKMAVAIDDLFTEPIERIAARAERLARANSPDQ